MAPTTLSKEEQAQKLKEADRGSNIAMVVLLGLSVLFVAFMFVYQRANRNKSRDAADELHRLKTTDAYLIKILQTFSVQQLDDLKFRGIQKKLQTATLRFEDITCKVWNGKEHQVVLEGITGQFHAGHLSAIMGPSGTGKTTLIDVLTGKKHSDSKWTVEGKVYVNDREQEIKALKPVIGFVPQDDTVHELLTVRENISFSAEMRMPRGTRKSRIDKITQDVLQVLQLEPKQNMIVGNRVLRGDGLSGGQRKRVNVGIELAACPTILFLDEPTSGLDSTASLLLVQQLKRMARLGMTIVMIIHQPRFTLFENLDDVLLLGTNMGGRLAYVGPTTSAKPYFEGLGIRMPANENPADWMMDVLCGQIDQKDSRISKSDVPQILFDKWRQNPDPNAGSIGETLGRPRGRSMAVSDDDEIECIKQNCKDHWISVFGSASYMADRKEFAKVLRSCTAVEPSDLILSEIIRRATDLMKTGRSEPDVMDYSTSTKTGLTHKTSSDAELDEVSISQRAFVSLMVAFRGFSLEDNRLRTMTSRMFMERLGADDENDSSSSSDSEDGEDEDDDGEGGHPFKHVPTLGNEDLHRVQAGCCTHLGVILHMSVLTFWRQMDIKILFLVIITFAAAFLAIFDRYIFQSPAWLPTTFINGQISLALLISVYCLQAFSNDQPMYWRMASFGLNRGAFLLARTLVDCLDWLLMTYFFVVTYYLIAGPKLQFLIFIWPFVQVGYVASGWGYAISCCLPVQYGPFLAALLMFTLGGILGLPMEMDKYLDGGLLEVIVDALSFTRWAGSESFLVYLREFPPDKSTLDGLNNHLLDLFVKNYATPHFMLPVVDTAWWTGTMALMTQGTVLRVIAWAGLRFTNRDRQI